MKKFNINNQEYTLEFTFRAAEHENTVQNFFNFLSGAYMIGALKKNVSPAKAMTDGTAKMIADIPRVTKEAFYAGLLENHKVTEDEAYEIMKAYMKENKISFRKLFDDIKECMADDGFFELSGLTEMLTELGQNLENNMNESK